MELGLAVWGDETCWMDEGGTWDIGAYWWYGFDESSWEMGLMFKENRCIWLEAVVRFRVDLYCKWVSIARIIELWPQARFWVRFKGFRFTPFPAPVTC